MQPITPGTTPVQTLNLQTTPAGTRAWQVGQVLNAMTLTAASQGKITLQIGAQRLEAQTPVPLKAGTPLQLEVVRTGEQPVLRILPAPPQAVPVNPEQQALRTALPRQAPLPPLLANLAALTGSGAKSPLPAPILQQVQTLLGQFAQAAQVANPSVLRQAVQQAGIFLEARLAQQAAGEKPLDTGKDLKAGLLRLQQALAPLARPAGATPGSPSPATPTPQGAPASPTAAAPQAPLTPVTTGATLPPPPLRQGAPQAQPVADASLTRIARMDLAATELLRQVDGALARLQLHQVASVPAPDSPPTWLLELPLKHGERTDLLHLRIEADAEHRRRDPATAAWTVSLAFDFPGLGPVHARVQVAGDQVSTVFWAEQTATAALFDAHLALLEADLAQSGLRIGQLRCHAGRPPQSAPGAPIRLLEERA